MYFYFRLDLLERDRSEVVVVNSYVVLSGEEMNQAGEVLAAAGITVLPLSGKRSRVDVAEELPDIPVSAAIGQEGVMVEDDALPTHSDGHLLGNICEALHEALLDVLHVMVPQDEIDPSVEPAQDVIPFMRVPEGEVAQVEHHAILRNGLVPVLHEDVVHLGDIPEGTVAVAKDVLMEEMRVGSEPDIVRFEDPLKVFLPVVLIIRCHRFAHIICS